MIFNKTKRYILSGIENRYITIATTIGDIKIYKTKNVLNIKSAKTLNNTRI